MELAFSPDFDALICYAIVLLSGAAVAISQMKQRIGEIDGIWFNGRTWWLFVIYTAVPVALFWFLDRTGAVNDTSFFAALLVGFGYERIMTGGSQSVRTPADVSQFWTPFIAYADRIAKVVRDKDAMRRRRLAERIIADIARDPGKIQILEDLARKYAPDIAALDKQLEAITASATARGPAAAAEAKVRALYTAVLTAPDVYDILLEAKLIGSRFYWLDIRRLRSLFVIVPVALLLVGAVILIISSIPDRQALWIDYHVWRTGKANTTKQDQMRARQHLATLLQDKEAGVRATEKLAALIQEPSLPVERIDTVLAILLTKSTTPASSHLPFQLVAALRASNVDARTRIHDALKYLAESCALTIGDDTLKWKPSDGDSIASLQRQIRRWEDYWAKPCRN